MKDPQGSGFIVSYCQHGSVGRKTARFVVTTRHVIAGGNCVVRFNAFSEGEPVIETYDRDKWIFHRDGDDVTITFVEFASGSGDFGCLPIQSNLIISPEAVEGSTVHIGDQVFMLGLFAGHFGQGQNQVLPAARFGNISMLPPQEIKNKDTGLEQESFLVEMYSMGGFSGSPVFVRRLPWTPDPRRIIRRRLRTHGFSKREALQNLIRSAENVLEEIWRMGQDEIFLLGVNWGHLPLEHKIKRRTVPNTPQELKDMYAEGNHNMACVVPAWKILELLEDEKATKYREEHGGDQKRSNTHQS